MRRLWIASVIVVFATSTASATTIVATDNQSGPTYPVNSAGSWTPSYDPINTTNDILLNASPSAQSGNFMLESSTGTPILTDGAFGAINGEGTFATHTNFATVGSGAGTSLTYSFAPAQLTSLVAYGGWNDNGRDQLDFAVSYSTDGGATFLPLGSVDFNPTVPNQTPSANRATFTDSSGLLAGGALIDALQFNFNQGDVENTYVGLAEIAAYQVPVPEPASLLLFALGAAGVFAVRRRSA